LGLEKTTRHLNNEAHQADPFSTNQTHSGLLTTRHSKQAHSGLLTTRQRPAKQHHSEVKEMESSVVSGSTVEAIREAILNLTMI
jgi:hypothetical protein